MLHIFLFNDRHDCLCNEVFAHNLWIELYLFLSWTFLFFLVFVHWYLVVRNLRHFLLINSLYNLLKRILFTKLHMLWQLLLHKWPTTMLAFVQWLVYVNLSANLIELLYLLHCPCLSPLNVELNGLCILFLLFYLDKR